MKTTLKTIGLFPFLFHWMVAFGYQPLDDFLTLADCLPEIVKIELESARRIRAIVITESDQKELAKCMPNIRKLSDLLIDYTPNGNALQIFLADIVFKDTEGEIKESVKFSYSLTEYVEKWLWRVTNKK